MSDAARRSSRPAAYPTRTVSTSRSRRSRRCRTALGYGPPRDGGSSARVVRVGERFAQLRLAAPVVAARGDRVIVRGESTVGGGTVARSRATATPRRGCASSCSSGAMSRRRSTGRFDWTRCATCSTASSTGSSVQGRGRSRPRGSTPRGRPSHPDRAPPTRSIRVRRCPPIRGPTTCLRACSSSGADRSCISPAPWRRSRVAKGRRTAL